MKVRDLPRAFGWRSAPREYPAEVETFHLAADGEVRLAQWRHPGETRKTVTQESVDALRAFLRPGDVAVDIGAHTGDSTLPMALAVGASGTVFALEPNPYVFRVLSLNASLNPDKAHIVPLMFAAMPADGEYDFEYSDSGYCNGGLHHHISRWKHGCFSKLRVQGRNLVEYLGRTATEELRRLRYIKIDTEGFDRAVTRSLRQLVERSRPFIRTEIYKHLPAAERAGYWDDLHDLGYRVFRCGDSEYRGEELRDRDDFGRWPHFDVFGVPGELA